MSRNFCASLATSAGGGSSATKCVRELLRDVLRGGGMTRQVGKHGAALLEAGVGIALAKHDLGARLVQALDECEFAAMVRLDRPHPASSR